MNTWLSAASNIAARNRMALCFLLAYFAAIFLYAGAYWGFCSNGFYDQYAHYEPSWKDETRRIESTIAGAFEAWSRQSKLDRMNASEAMPVQGVGRRFEVTNLSISEESHITFDITYERQIPLPPDSPPLLPGVAPNDIIFETDTVSMAALLAKNIDRPGTSRASPFLSNSGFLLVTPTSDNDFHEWNGKTRRLAITDEQKKSIDEYIGEYNGLSDSIGHNYTRMLYLSSVIITTLGLGDIIPLSDRARLIVGAEAITGIILIGAFINSVTSRNKRAATPRKDGHCHCDPDAPN